MVGGGSNPRPGEVTLSHNGILFLDEFPEFNRNVLEALRQPLEDREVTISRANKSLRFPAQFMLVASMNPCPCGYLTDPKKRCRCSTQQIQNYLNKISGPLLDRIDLHLDVPPLKPAELLTKCSTEPSDKIRERTTLARERQHHRFQGLPIYANALMNHAQVRKFCELSADGETVLKSAFDQLGLSARAHDRILKVARTIADLEGGERIQNEHLIEAISYRSLDRQGWIK